MQRFYKIVALCLATLWLPVVLCCALEAAGVQVICAGADCHETTDRAANDGCNIVEDGAYNPALAPIKIAPPAIDVCACVICSRALEEPREMASGLVLAATERPRDWVPIWQFERRAAAPAHAPDAVIA